jgi:hypothetical protein
LVSEGIDPARADDGAVLADDTKGKLGAAEIKAENVSHGSKTH